MCLVGLNRLGWDRVSRPSRCRFAILMSLCLFMCSARLVAVQIGLCLDSSCLSAFCGLGARNSGCAGPTCIWRYSAGNE